MITTLTTATGISVVKFIFQQLEIGANRTKSWKKTGDWSKSQKHNFSFFKVLFLRKGKKAERGNKSVACCSTFCEKEKKRQLSLLSFQIKQRQQRRRLELKKNWAVFFAIGDVPRSSFLLSGTNIEEFAKVCEIYRVAQKWQHRHYFSWSWDSTHWCICS